MRRKYISAGAGGGGRTLGQLKKIMVKTMLNIRLDRNAQNNANVERIGFCPNFKNSVYQQRFFLCVFF
jgi:hypothetical protein